MQEKEPVRVCIVSYVCVCACPCVFLCVCTKPCVGLCEQISAACPPTLLTSVSMSLAFFLTVQQEPVIVITF
jgi:hypothetical protein